MFAHTFALSEHFWIDVIQAAAPTLMALAAFIQSIRNGSAAKLAAEKAVIAAQKTDQVQADLHANTRITAAAAIKVSETQDVVAKVEQQTNGGRLRIDAMLEKMIDHVGRNTAAIGVLERRFTVLEDSMIKLVKKAAPPPETCDGANAPAG